MRVVVPVGGPGPRGSGAQVRAAVAVPLEGAARLLLRALEVLPATRARIIGALGGVAMAAGVVMLTTAACGPLDFQCKADAWGEGVVEGLRATFSSLTHSMIQGVFSGSLGTLGSSGWAAGMTLAGRVGAIVAIVVVGLAAVQIGMTLVAKQREGILRAAVGALLAWPVASAAIWAAQKMVYVIDAIANRMVEESHIETLSRLADFTMVVSLSTPLTAGLVALFFVFCVFIPTVLMSLMMAFRNYGIVLAIAVAPVSLMVWGFSAMRGMSRGWLKVVLALILTKPILAIALVVGAEMIVQSSAGDFDIGGFLTGVAGLVMAVFAPFAAMGMVSGAMAIADTNIMRGAEGGAMRFGSQAAHSASGGVKRAGSRAVGALAQTNPKTAALWNLAHGGKPSPKGQGATGQGSVPPGKPPMTPAGNAPQGMPQTPPAGNVPQGKPQTAAPNQPGGHGPASGAAAIPGNTGKGRPTSASTGGQSPQQVQEGAAVPGAQAGSGGPEGEGMRPPREGGGDRTPTGGEAGTPGVPRPSGPAPASQGSDRQQPSSAGKPRPSGGPKLV